MTDLSINKEENLTPAIIANQEKRKKLKEIYDFDGRTYYLKEAVVKAEKSDYEYFIPRIWSFPNAKVIKYDDLPSRMKRNNFSVINRNFGGVYAQQALTGAGFCYSISIVRNRYNSLSGGNAPQILIDNVYSTAEDVYFLNPLNVESIEIVKGPDAAIFGANGAGGAVLVYTKRGINSYQSLNIPNFYKTYMKGFQKYKDFYTVDYSEKQEYCTPDMRTTLYWNPEITASTEKLSFYNHDNVGEMKVIMEGFTVNGQPFRKTFNYNIR